MPIRREQLDKYPKDWPEIRARILERARHRCELCGVRNHAWGWRDPTGKFHQVPKRPILETYPKDERRNVRPPFTIEGSKGPLRIVEIVLTIAHWDNHDPADCRPENLKAACQRCHNRHDRPMRSINAAATRRSGRALGDLFA